MRRFRAYAAIGLCAGIALWVLLQVAGSPVLYPVGDGGVTPFHTDPAGLVREKTGEPSGTLIPLMHDISSLRGSITLHIREKDLEKAEEELTRLTALSGTYRNLVVSLDMNQSELEAFRTANDKSIRSLGNLVRDRARMEDLQRLEVQFRDDRDPAMLSAVIVEGATLQKMIEREVADAEEADAILSRTEATMNLTPAGAPSQKEMLETVVTQTVAQRQEWDKDLLATRVATPTRKEKEVSAIRVSVFPGTAEYGVPFRVSGQVLGRNVAGRPVEVLLDYSPALSTVSGPDGSYEAVLPADNLTEGSHSILVRTGSARSDLYLVSVRSVGGVLTLSAVTQGNGARFNGVLTTASGMPVHGVPVLIMLDGVETATVTTGPDGKYSGQVTLAQPKKGNRTYTLRASFEGQEVPVRPALSPPVSVKVSAVQVPLSPTPDTGPLPAAILVPAAVLLLSCVAAAWYLLRKSGVYPAHRRQKQGSTASPEEDKGPGPIGGSPGVVTPFPPAVPGEEPAVGMEIIPAGTADVPSPPPDPGEAADYFRRESLADPRHAAAALYRSLRALATERRQVSPSPSLTPREFCRQVTTLLPSDAIREFITRYEQARYARDLPGPSESERVLNLFRSVVLVIRGEEDRGAER